MPPEISLVGQNGAAGWGWEIAIDLFLGGLAAGLLIFSGLMRLLRPGGYRRALFVADLAGFPLLSIGMLFLFLDLSNRMNVWRLYTTFQISSAMSWGAWSLLLTMALLALRFGAVVAKIEQIRILRRFFEGLSSWVNRHDRILALAGICLGAMVGIYTGVLLSQMPARPLWNTAVLALLFLVSGLASGCAFLCLFLTDEEHDRLLPYSILLSGIELLLLLAFALNLRFGNEAVRRAGAVLFSGTFGWIFWGLVILAGMVVPVVLEQWERKQPGLPFLQTRIPPVLKLAGRLALRFVIVYAGLLSFV